MRGQLQAMETIIVAIVLIVLLMIGVFVFVALDEPQGPDPQATQDLALRLSNLPELSCEKQGLDTSVCIDAIKAELLGEWLTNPESPQYDEFTRLYYADIFGDADIRIKELYPGDDEILLFDGLRSDNYFAAQLPVVLYDAREERYVLAQLEVLK